MRKIPPRLGVCMSSFRVSHPVSSPLPRSSPALAGLGRLPSLTLPYYSLSEPF